MSSRSSLNSIRAAVVAVCLAAWCFGNCQRVTDRAVKEQIRQQLLHSLKASDLNLSKAALTAKIARLGRNSRLFKWQQEAAPLTKVGGSNGEWVVMMRSTSDQLAMAVKGYWLGSHGNRLLVSPIPYDEDSMTGPILGEWRRHGQYVIGVGIIEAFHSPTWADGEIRVFTIGRGGLVLRQTVPLNWADSIGFASKFSDDIVGRDNHAEFQSIEGGKREANRETRWRLSHRRYHVIHQRIIHDELWALDRLVTAVKHREYNVQRQMIPNRASRKWLVAQIGRCIRDDRLRIDKDGPGDALGLKSKQDLQTSSNFWLRFRIRRGIWIVGKITSP